MIKHLNIIFDIDGIMSDIWTSAESNGYTKNLIFRKDVSDYEMSTLSDKDRQAAFKALTRPKNYEFPMPMPVSRISSVNWMTCDNIETTGEFLRLTEWADFLKKLTESHNIMLHTHCMTPESAIARLKWFKREINSEKIGISIDIGNDKSIKSCDLLFDDSLKNILKSNASCRCMPALFHNMSTSEHNRQLYKESNKPDFVYMPSDFKAYETAIDATLCYLNADSTKTARIDKFSETFKALYTRKDNKNELD